jgi:hypothetical protein
VVFKASEEFESAWLWYFILARLGCEFIFSCGVMRTGYDKLLPVISGVLVNDSSIDATSSNRLSLFKPGLYAADALLFINLS